MGSESTSIFQRAFVRITQFRNRRRHHYSAIQLDLDLLWNGFSDHIRRETVFLRYLLDSAHTLAVARDHHAAGILSKQHKLRWKVL